MVAEGGVAELAAGQGVEGVVLALGGGAGVGAGGVVGGLAVDAGLVVGGVAHAGCGEFGQPGVDVGAQFGGGDHGADAHAVGALAAPGEAALAGAVGVGEGAVGVDQDRGALGGFVELVGAQLGGVAGQQLFGVLDDGRGGVGGQVADEGLDDAQVGGVEQAFAPLRGGGGQLGGQFLAGEGDPRAQLCGVFDAAARFGVADAAPVGDDLMDRPADVGGVLEGQAVDDVVAEHGLQALGGF
ncbi:MAG: hypothetical protein QOH45_1319 [Pseudonocardiales bacterium]|nr:hypothetical protein [Pseudonocardiales bacterium]